MKLSSLTREEVAEHLLHSTRERLVAIVGPQVYLPPDDVSFHVHLHKHCRPRFGPTFHYVAVVVVVVVVVDVLCCRLCARRALLVIVHRRLWQVCAY